MKIVRRYGILLAGLLIMAFGVAFSIKADLGTSPISSMPYVASLIVPLSVGEATIIMHCAFILLQIILLRKGFKLIQLMQLPVALVFGYMIDFALWSIDAVTCPNYLMQWIWCVVGIIFVGVGVSLEVVAGVVTLAGEGLVLALCRVFHWKFSNAKIGFDTSLVLIASVLSLIFLHRLCGVREGTIAAAFLVGAVARILNRCVLHLMAPRELAPRE